MKSKTTVIKGKKLVEHLQLNDIEFDEILKNKNGKYGDYQYDLMDISIPFNEKRNSFVFNDVDIDIKNHTPLVYFIRNIIPEKTSNELLLIHSIEIIPTEQDMFEYSLKYALVIR